MEEAIFDRHRPLPPLPMPTTISSTTPTPPFIFLHLVPYVALPPKWSQPSIVSPCRIPLAEHRPVLRSKTAAHTPSHTTTTTPAPSLSPSPSDSSLTLISSPSQPQFVVDPSPSHSAKFHRSPLAEIQNYLVENLSLRWSCHRSSSHSSSISPKMNTYAHSPSKKTIPSSPKRLRDKQALAQAEAEAAERAVIEDTDAWNDISDDEDFVKSDNNTVLSRSTSSGHPPPTTTTTTSMNKPVQKPKHKPSSILSGSGRGIWDVPATTAVASQPSPARSQSIPLSNSPNVYPPSTSAGRFPSSSSLPVSASSSGLPSSSQAIKDPAVVSPVRPDFADLVRDPAHVLNQLRLAHEAQQAELVASERQPTGPGSLPWEAVIPAELMSPSNVNSSAAAQALTAEPECKSSLPSTPLPPSDSECKQSRRAKKFLDCLSQPTVDVSELRKLAWSGIPPTLRPIVWQILLGYLPAPAERRVGVLGRKRQEYADAVRLAFGAGLDMSIWHQIHIDVPRTNPGVALWQFPATQRSLERILYVWAIRHPASGYVQGINDLVTPFFEVFLSAYVTLEPDGLDVGTLPSTVIEAVEADTFWCLSKLLDGIQDNYIFAQPGIQRLVARMKELCKRVDSRLHQHLEDEKVEFIQFAFRWINCLLMRELSTKTIIRMWDTYLAEGTTAFSEFHLYVCVAFLVKYSEKLCSMDFQAIIIFLQALPTQDWTEKDTELVLSQAFMWYSLFQGATGHFVRK